MQLTEKDKKEMKRFGTGFPWMEIVAPATKERGIRILDETMVENAVDVARKAISDGRQALRFAKFVPASGAASRMFKDLFSRNAATVERFSSDIRKFAFYDESLFAGCSAEQMVEKTLGGEGLNYGVKPKAVLKFHRYAAQTRTAIAEHLVEAADYMKAADGTANLVVTISPEHQQLFDEAIAEVRAGYEEKYGVKYDIRTVFQHKWTDTIAVTPQGEPFITDDGDVLHRPGGHGALIHNLNEVDADVVSVKNIDNVAVESYLPTTAKWKRVLIGMALIYREKLASCMDDLRSGVSEVSCTRARTLLEDDFCICMPSGFDALSLEDRAGVLLSLLDRPLRVCGMVKNEGEPGGGPFIIREKDGSTSLQILEAAQINPDDKHAVECLKGSTHFNPVDLVCVLTDASGKHYDLLKYVDEDAGFISSKSYQGRELKALELPGLWNGSMSRWNTLFVEVPAETFNPVKTVLDLLRPAHQN